MKKTITEKITIILFICFIAIFTILNVLAPKKDYSENENRNLSSFPSLTLSSIFGGNFDDAFETWFSDHFVFRDEWIELKSISRKVTGSIENNNVYYGKDNHLIKSFLTYSNRTINQNINYINDFSKNNNIKANILIVPTSASIEDNLLPIGSYNVNQYELLSYLKNSLSEQNFIDIYDLLKENKDNNLYYSTDHHWNEKGAYLAYTQICNQVLNTNSKEFNYETVSNDFYGTMYSKSGAFWVDGDTINKINPINEITVKVNYDNELETDSVFNEKRLSEKDKYMYYLDGNHAIVSINTSVNNDKKAVIVQDSYAHILIPYLISEYEEIEVIDPRYYHDEVSSLIDDKTDLYFIYSLDNFAEDTSLVFLK